MASVAVLRKEDLDAVEGAPVPPIEFETALVGELDGEVIDLLGRGTIDEYEGATDGVFEMKRVPSHVDPRALGAFLFTGYPNSCRTRDAGVPNPFSGSGYSYERTYSFADSDARALLSVRCDLSGDGRRLQSVFRLTGTLSRPLKRVVGVTPIYELWSPRDDCIDGLFGVGWLQEGVDAVVDVAIAASRYNAARIGVLGGRPKHRFIRLDSCVDSAGHLRVTQQSHLVDPIHKPL